MSGLDQSRAWWARAERVIPLGTQTLVQEPDPVRPGRLAHLPGPRRGLARVGRGRQRVRRLPDGARPGDPRLRRAGGRRGRPAPAGRRHHLHAHAPARGRGGRAHRGHVPRASRPCASPRAAPTPSAAPSAPPAPTPVATWSWSAATTAGTTGTSARPPATAGVPGATRELTATFPYGDREGLELVLDRHRGRGRRRRARAVGGHRARARLPAERASTPPTATAPCASSTRSSPASAWPPAGRRERYGVVPDLACYGKALGNGMPIAAIGGPWELMAVFEEIFFSGTHGGEALSLAAARVVLDTLADGTVLAGIETLGRTMLDGIAELIEAHDVGPPGDRRRRAAAVGRRLRRRRPAGGQELGAADAWPSTACMFNGSMFICARHTPADVDQALAAFDEAFAGLAGDASRSSARLKGPPSSPSSAPRERTGAPAPRSSSSGPVRSAPATWPTWWRPEPQVTSTDPDDASGRAPPRPNGTVPFDLDHLDGYDGIVVASPTRLPPRAGPWPPWPPAPPSWWRSPWPSAPTASTPWWPAAGARLMVGYNLRLHRPVEELVDLVAGRVRIGAAVAARLWFGSWLPDWRPGVDYRTSVLGPGRPGRRRAQRRHPRARPGRVAVRTRPAGGGRAWSIGSAPSRSTSRTRSAPCWWIPPACR